MFGVLLIVGGMAWLLGVTGVASVSFQLMVATLLVLLGLGMILTRSSRGFVFLGALMVLFLSLGSHLSSVHNFDINVPRLERTFAVTGTGDRVIAPDHLGALESEYRMGAGTFTLDLTSIEIPEGVTKLESRLGVGEMVVIVPMGVGVEGDARVGVGEIIVFGKTLESGLSVGVELNQPVSSGSILRLDLSVGLGSIEIRRGS